VLPSENVPNGGDTYVIHISAYTVRTSLIWHGYCKQFRTIWQFKLIRVLK